MLEVDPVTADLDLAIDPAQVGRDTVVTYRHPVARAIEALERCSRIDVGDKCLNGRVIVITIAQGDGWTSNEKLADTDFVEATAVPY